MSVQHAGIGVRCRDGRGGSRRSVRLGRHARARRKRARRNSFPSSDRFLTRTISLVFGCACPGQAPTTLVLKRLRWKNSCWIQAGRRFVRGLSGALATAALPYTYGRTAGSVAAADSVLTGTEFDLEVNSLEVNFTGARRIATAVNGQVPGPLLRWREGDTITVRVANRLHVPTSIHWHGVIVPSDMDGVPGLSFRRHRARRDLRLPLPSSTSPAPTGTTATPASRSRSASTDRS